MDAFSCYCSILLAGCLNGTSLWNSSSLAGQFTSGLSMALCQLDSCKKLMFNTVTSGCLFRAPHWLVPVYAVPLSSKVNIVLLSLTQGSLWANEGTSAGHEKKSESGRNSGRECVCSCSLVCLAQNWFKAPGHRKKATLYSRHVLETSSRGSSIAIQQRQLQTPKWVCSVLQCPTWQSATCSTSLAPNTLPLLLLLLYFLFQFIPFSLCLFQSVSLASLLSIMLYFSPPHSA